MFSTLGGSVPLSGAAHAIYPDARCGRAELFFRPEDASLTTPDQAQLQGVVETAQFLGERTRLRIAGAAPDTLTIDVAGHIELSCGMPVGLNLRPDALLAFA